MFSILIPTYNYDISSLVQNVHAQLYASKIAFEIIVLEDGSTKYVNTCTNFSNTQIIVNKNNLGRVKARQFLANKAKYSWLLFLDADVLPKHSSFITDYIKKTKQDCDAIFGGFAYYKEKPNKSYTLRWKYGQTKEQVPALTRNKKPYKVIISANYLIKKNIFKTINSKMTSNGYGYDNYFGSLLKQEQVRVLHIDNEVYHLGIEKSIDYFSKKEQAAKTLIRLYDSNTITTHDNDLLRLFSKLKKYKLTGVFSGIYKVLKSILIFNLTSAFPSIKVLQFYRILYMCYSSRLKNIETNTF